MYPDHFIRDHEVPDEQHVPGHDQRISSHRVPRRYQIRVLFGLTLFGLYLLAAPPGAGKGDTLSAHYDVSGHALVHTGVVAGPVVFPDVGLGAGAASGGSTNANAQAAVCINPLAATCWLQNAAQWMAQQLMNALQPGIGAIMSSPLNILTQTPPVAPYQNPVVITWWNAFLAVVDLALASLIVIGGYNFVVGRHLGLPHSELAEVLPRLLLAFGAAHFSPFFLGPFIHPLNPRDVGPLYL